ncbi:MAG TPA: hypothetical protein VIX89_19075 [Bryobacteraceae bacterium]
MRIIIDIDGNDVKVTTEPAVAAIAPPELLAAAAALGAHNAGPAPASPAGVVNSPLSHAELKAISGVTDAGSAPTAGKKSPIKKAASKPAARSKKRR